jgi:hypothetical protein
MLEYDAMTDSTANAADKSGVMPIVNLGQERAEAAMILQRELLDAYEQASRAWLARVQSEVQLWSELATKLIATRSASEAVQAYTKSVSRRMQMSAEDGKRLLDDCQRVTSKITKSLAPDGDRN